MISVENRRIKINININIDVFPQRVRFTRTLNLALLIIQFHSQSKFIWWVICINRCHSHTFHSPSPAGKQNAILNFTHSDDGKFMYYLSVASLYSTTMPNWKLNCSKMFISWRLLIYYRNWGKKNATYLEDFHVFVVFGTIYILSMDLECVWF